MTVIIQCARCGQTAKVNDAIICENNHYWNVLHLDKPSGWFDHNGTLICYKHEYVLRDKKEAK